MENYKILNIKIVRPEVIKPVLESLLSEHSEKDLFCKYTDNEVIYHI